MPRRASAGVPPVAMTTTEMFSAAVRIAARLVREVRDAGPPPGPLNQLSPRETQVLAQLARGRSNREIAKTLAITEETVKAHVSSILAKLQLSDRTQAAIFGLQQGLVPLGEALDQPG